MRPYDWSIMFRKSSNDANLELEIDRVLLAMKDEPVDSAIYADLLERYNHLIQAKAKTSAPPISKDVLLTVIANIAGILLVLNYEKANIITTRAIGYVKKLN